MAGTRSSSRIAAKQDSSPQTSSKQAAGTKHKTEHTSSPAAKRGKKSAGKEQKTLEEIIGNDDPEKVDGEKENGEELKHEDQAPEKQEETAEAEDRTDQDVAMEETQTKDKSDKTEHDKSTTNGISAVEPQARNEETPSNILEKGLIYFFFRGRVGIDDPHNVSDIQRSYFILRPIAHGAKLNEGPIGDEGNNRLIALPKKVLPLSGKDRYITFVEKTKVSFQTLKEEFLSSNDYMTKTAGVRHSPAATPVGEGIYAITTTGRESHLAYILTIPSEIDEVQKEIGLKEQGSFIISTKNPDTSAPNNAQLPKPPEFPDSIKEEFGSLRWTATKPSHLDVPNCQVLLISESSGLDKATEPQKEDAGKEDPKEEMEKLEHEDEVRVEGLKGDESDAIFRDLKVHGEEMRGLKTTF